MEFEANRLRMPTNGWSLLSHGCSEKLGQCWIPRERALQKAGKITSRGRRLMLEEWTGPHDPAFSRSQRKRGRVLAWL